jgi:UDP-sugar transporter A1/2/3
MAMTARKPVSQDVENQPLLLSSGPTEMHTVQLTPVKDSQSKPKGDAPAPKSGQITAIGFKVLALLAFQNSFKNILMRFVMKDHAGFLLSTAVIVVELLKLFFSMGYIVLVLKQSPLTVVTFIRSDWKNTLLLVVPATAYSLQMTLEYIAMANIDPASFSVLVQMKMLTTALFFRTILKKRLMKKQLMSLVVLTVGVMLCSMKMGEEKENQIGNKSVGLAATLGTFFYVLFFLECNEIKGNSMFWG